MAKMFRRERFSIFKAEGADRKKAIFERMCRAKLEGELTLEGDVFYLDGHEIFRPAEGTRREWQKWHQLWVELDDSPYVLDGAARSYRSKKNWGYGSKSTWKSSRRFPFCHSAERRREQMARDRAEKGKG